MSKFLIAYILIIVSAVGLLWGVNQILFSTGDQQAVVKLVIEKNQSVLHIAKKLLNEGVVRSRTLFLFYSYISGSYAKYQPGTYVISPELSLRDVVRLLITGPQDVTATIIPGMTLKEIDEMLTRRGIIKKGSIETFSTAELINNFSFIKNAKTLEGFLMPDTYRFKPSSEAYEVANILLSNFAKENRELSYETLIKASLIEKEVIDQMDRVLVAGVIERRLAIGMPLQIDATVRYAACDKRFTECGVFKRSDFSIDSPYNTYTHKGLPPAPICNPSQSAIDAARNPKKSDFLYYLSKRETGETVFSKTLQEHNKNRELYLGL